MRQLLGEATTISFALALLLRRRNEDKEIQMQFESGYGFLKSIFARNRRKFSESLEFFDRFFSRFW